METHEGESSEDKELSDLEHVPPVLDPSLAKERKTQEITQEIANEERLKDLEEELTKGWSCQNNK